MSEWVRVADLNECPAGQLKGVMVNGQAIVLANVDGRVYALEDQCSHEDVSRCPTGSSRAGTSCAATTEPGSTPAAEPVRRSRRSGRSAPSRWRSATTGSGWTWVEHARFHRRCPGRRVAPEPVPGAHADRAREAAGLPRQRGDLAEAASRPGRSRGVLRAGQRERAPGHPRAVPARHRRVRSGPCEGRRWIGASDALGADLDAGHHGSHQPGRGDLGPGSPGSAGDEILLSVLEHHSNIVPWQLLAVARAPDSATSSWTTRADSSSTTSTSS